MYDYLFSKPSFLSGLARVLDIFALYDSYNTSSSEEEADAKAIYSDWKAVGCDLEQSVTEENKTQQINGQE